MKLIILDRDGVINEDSDDYIKSPDEWRPIPGSLEAIARLNEAGYQVVVATNQSGIGRGLFDVETLAAMHEKMHRLLAAYGGHIDAVFFCPHAPGQRCGCRKPAPGLFAEIAQRFGVDLGGVPAVGDSLRDIEVAQAVGAQPMLVRTGKGQRTLAAGKVSGDVPIFDDLAHVADTLVNTGEMT
ncbi:D-glycero-beta-D-manno-heptose-1,7-bisphosphate 7-phosphatase [Acidihalobacter yilgarnensis]|uniref:D,D-heptose 1,7-bisphosphate phosphatase n=1 Tax=Acidihalobacter yilgarnensis TaxID=2819280 RepID=A0A1D8ITU6_9GAMM|nr:D-glycero-beta-D-manno-heptose 1,7-bisphosphate 7-phosphatase [Acidihalobacter yilgarnensis]AOU99817.1 D-glycero-beta-D-manno-heptose-1,7-bisphosphate 7-phosphatase [Acidihalobacter yilgarnensis]